MDKQQPAKYFYLTEFFFFLEGKEQSCFSSNMLDLLTIVFSGSCWLSGLFVFKTPHKHCGKKFTPTAITSGAHAFFRNYTVWTPDKFALLSLLVVYRCSSLYNPKLNKAWSHEGSDVFPGALDLPWGTARVCLDLDHKSEIRAEMENSISAAQAVTCGPGYQGRRNRQNWAWAAVAICQALIQDGKLFNALLVAITTLMQDIQVHWVSAHSVTHW